MFLIIVLGVISAKYFYVKQFDRDVLKDLQGSPEVVVESGEYQAVFLDNGQVYFGKLSKTKQQFFLLTDVFYMQSGSAAPDKAANLSLSKLGGEAHGPEDKMEINVDHILFIEDMKSDSKVVKAINQYKTNNK